MVNDKFVQLHGPFGKDEELVDKIKENFSDFQSIKKIGIQSEPTNICYLNGQIFEIGKTGILEIDEANITSVYFKQNELEATLVDCVLK
jgi:hypothetical protein